MVCFEPDDIVFQKTCDLISDIDGVIESAFLIDVDESLYRHYRHRRGEIAVCKAYYFDNEVRVESDFELEPFLGDKWFLKKITC